VSSEACRSLSEEQLARRALEGGDDAWSELARRHGHRVLISLLARGVPLEIAEDVVQETWLRLVEQGRAGRLRTLRMPGIAIAQAHWISRELLRSRQRRESIAGPPLSLEACGEQLEIADPGVDLERLSMQRQRLEVVQRELQRCSARARQVFYAVYGPSGCSHDETARQTGVSLQRVRQMLHEMRVRLRRVLAAMDAEDEA